MIMGSPAWHAQSKEVGVSSRVLNVGSGVEE